MTVAALLITDGRDDLLGETVAAFEANARGDITERWLYDDVGDTAHAARLAGLYPAYTVLSAGKRLGFGGAISFAWSHLADHSTADHVAHVEDDMMLNQPVDLTQLAAVLTEQPHLAQMALRRQPVNDQERAAGGVVEQHPEAYTDRSDGAGRAWLEHTLFWTTNPSLFRRDLCTVGWLDGKHSEGRFGFHLREVGLPWGVAGGDVRFAYWGARTDPPLVHHIGDVRVGTGY